MFETVLIATDGSDSAARAVRMALDLADRFDATVHALYVVDAGDVRASPPQVREDLAAAFETAAEDALAEIGGAGLRVRHDIGTQELLERRIDHMTDLRGD